MINIDTLLKWAVEKRASDLHLTVGTPPSIRVNGRIFKHEGVTALKNEDIESFAKELINDVQYSKLEKNGELDFSYGLARIGRFRCSLYKQRGSLSLAARVVPSEILSASELGLPSVIKTIASLEDGLVLVTGPTGSGKSTTLACILDIINSSRRGVIVTLEDPIEYLHRHNSCIVNQREIGSDSMSFASGLRTALRSDPDVILVGEMRDLETISIALRAAETGHLVLSSLHTRSAAATIDRIIDSFPSQGRQQIRIQLATTIEAVISQRLLLTRDEESRVLATEILMGTPAIRNMIREGKTHTINNAIETGTRYGMHTMESDINRLTKAGIIDRERAI